MSSNRGLTIRAAEQLEGVTPDKLDRYIDEIKGAVTQTFISMGLILKVIKESKAYLDLGYNTFNEYVREKDMTRMTAYKMIWVYETFVEQLGVPEERLKKIGPAKLYTIRSVVEDDPDEWLSRAEHLYYKQLVFEVKRLKGNIKENPERMAAVTELMMPKLEALTSELPDGCWASVYTRDPAPGVVELIIRVSTNERPDDE